MLAPAGVVGEIEDVLPRGGQVGADGEVFGVFEEALAGGILPTNRALAATSALASTPRACTGSTA